MTSTTAILAKCFSSNCTRRTLGMLALTGSAGVMYGSIEAQKAKVRSHNEGNSAAEESYGGLVVALVVAGGLLAGIAFLCCRSGFSQSAAERRPDVKEAEMKSIAVDETKAVTVNIAPRP